MKREQTPNNVLQAGEREVVVEVADLPAVLKSSIIGKHITLSG